VEGYRTWPTICEERNHLAHRVRGKGDEQRLQMCLCPHNVDEVLKIRPMKHGRDDFVAWYYEKSCIFIVKSGYRLAVENMRRNEGLDAGSSGATDGRALYKELWNADVPQRFEFLLGS
jgi:hypothetical protein